jgi:preprotein translocase subunit SecA
MNKQREEIYSFRNEALHSQDLLALAREVLEGICVHMCHQFFSSRSTDAGWDPEGYRQWLLTHFPLSFDAKEFDDDYLKLEEIEQLASGKVIAAFNQKLTHESEKITKAQSLFETHHSEAKMSPSDVLREVIRNLLIRNIDRIWQEHLLHIDHLRTEVHLRAVGQKDPLLEFKHEAFTLFDSLTTRIKQEIAHALFKFEMIIPEERLQQKPAHIQMPRRRPLIDLSQFPELEHIFPATEKDP